MAYKVREAAIPILPPGSPDIRVLHFSDLHLTPRRKREIADIKSFISLKPDLVISTGDFLAHPGAVPVVLDALDELLNLPGLYVFGSNDYYEPSFKNPIKYLMKDNGTRKLGKELPWQELDRALAQRGWKNVNTSKVTFSIKEILIEARGTDDAHLGLDNYSVVKGDVNPNAQISIGITHAPYSRVLNSMAADNLDVIFAGHTHGGQIRIPWIKESKALTTNCDLPLWRSRGVTKIKNEPWLNVSAGMGTSPFARVRIACPPEITICTLKALKY
jgi:predicted MPP superfamily phosphohydrolase